MNNYLEAADTGAMTPWIFGAAAGGLIMKIWMDRGPSGSKKGLSGLGLRRCTRYGRGRGGRKVCRRYRTA